MFFFIQIGNCYNSENDNNTKVTVNPKYVLPVMFVCVAHLSFDVNIIKCVMTVTPVRGLSGYMLKTRFNPQITI